MRADRSTTPVILLALAACSGAGVAASPTPPAASGTTRSEAAVPSAGPSVASSPSAVPPPAPAKVERFPGTTFPPANIEPPSARSAKAGDGAWSVFGGADDRARQPPAAIYVTVLHPHRVSKWKTLTVAAIDLRAAVLHYVPGADDVKPEALPEGALPGLVASEHHDRLLAVMNGGFKPNHGRWGMYLEGRSLVPPRTEGCTVAITREDEVQITPHDQLGELAPIRAYRQTPPCLVNDGELHPRLLAHSDRAWGGHDPKRKTRRRSALGIDKSGRVLLYGLSEELEPRELAEGMRLAGAHSAAQLDINWSWTRFLLFKGEPASLPKASTTLIPKMVTPRRGYVEKPGARDFFYLIRRAE